MTTIAIQTTLTSNKRLVALLVLLLLSSVGMFGQESKIELPSVIETTVAADGDDQGQMELVSWFMASKKTQSVGSKSFNAISTNGSGKKSMINSGLTPNRILSRTFLKKLTSQQTTIA